MTQAVPQTTGVTHTMGNAMGIAVTSYVVHYSYPSVAKVGTNLTVSLSLHLNQFSTSAEYISNYDLEAQLFIGPNVLQETVYGPLGINSTLYPGATWGPLNFTFPLNESNTGVARGTSENATLSVTLKDTLYELTISNIDQLPYLNMVLEPPMQASAGSLIIENPASQDTSGASNNARSGAVWDTVIVIAVVGVLAGTALVLWKRGASGREAG
jgi:hypothetical protein